MTAESGGGAFVLIYILSVILLALPIMCAEILIGKRGKQNPVNTLRTLSTEASYYTRDESDLSLNRTVKVKKQFENNDLFSEIEWKEMYELSEDTFVDESDDLKQQSAGAGLTDND